MTFQPICAHGECQGSILPLSVALVRYTALPRAWGLTPIAGSPVGARKRDAETEDRDGCCGCAGAGRRAGADGARRAAMDAARAGRAIGRVGSLPRATRIGAGQ